MPTWLFDLHERCAMALDLIADSNLPRGNLPFCLALEVCVEDLYYRVIVAIFVLLLHLPRIFIGEDLVIAFDIVVRLHEQLRDSDRVMEVGGREN